MSTTTSLGTSPFCLLPSSFCLLSPAGHLTSAAMTPGWDAGKCRWTDPRPAITCRHVHHHFARPQRAVEYLIGHFARHEPQMSKLPESALQSTSQGVRVLWSTDSRGVAFHSRRDCSSRPEDGSDGGAATAAREGSSEGGGGGETARCRRFRHRFLRIFVVTTTWPTMCRI